MVHWMVYARHFLIITVYPRKSTSIFHTVLLKPCFLLCLNCYICHVCLSLNQTQKNNDEKDCMGNHTVALLLHGNLDTKSEFSFFLLKKNLIEQISYKTQQPERSKDILVASNRNSCCWQKSTNVIASYTLSLFSSYKSILISSLVYLWVTIALLPC